MTAGTRRLALLAGFGLLGCSAPVKRLPYDENPILKSREPLVAKPTDGPKTPAPPRAVAMQPPPPPAADPFERPTPKPVVPVQAFAPAPPIPPLPNGPPLPVPAFEAEPAATPAAPVVPVSYTPAVKPAAKLGHAPTYSWIVGTLDRHYRGALELRYTDPSEDDAHGGKVRLEPDPRFGEFRPGDVIRVEGELVQPDAEDSDKPEWDRPRRFHARTITLVERGR